MKTITIRKLHDKTGECVRMAARYGEVAVTHRGRAVAKIVPHEDEQEVPFFARRKLTPAFRRLAKSGKLRGGTDSTKTISQDRSAR
jgi:antitoxin (DNA-binding transcriptional repressor) of toxin-antitoxin stability system